MTLVRKEPIIKWQSQDSSPGLSEAGPVPSPPCHLPFTCKVINNTSHYVFLEASQPQRGSGVWIWKTGRAPEAEVCIREGFPEKVALETSQRNAEEAKGPRQ